MFSNRLPVVLLASILAVPVSAQRPEFDAKALHNDVRTTVADLIQKGEPAVMLVVVRDGKVLLTYAAGQATKELPATEATLFPMGLASRLIANLVLAQLAKDRVLAVDASVNKLIAPLSLRDPRGKPLTLSLESVMAGKAQLAGYRNLVAKEDRAKWSLQRAIAEHGFDTNSYQPSELRYGVVQVAAEKATKKPWAEVVQSTVATPLKLRRLIADAGGELPRSAAQPHGRGAAGKPVPETRHCTDLPAAHGAWIDAPDLGRLLLHLLKVSGDRNTAAQIKALVGERIEFTGFRVNSRGEEDRCHVALRASMPGLSGDINVFPQHKTAWAAFTSSSHSRSYAMPPALLKVLMKHLLPEEASHDRAIGMGAFAAAARARPKAQELRGEWVAKLRFCGQEQPLRLWIGEAKVEKIQFGDRPPMAATARRLAPRLTVRSQDFLGARPDLAGGQQLRTRMSLRLEGEGADAVFAGTLFLDSEYCRMALPVRFKKAADKEKPDSRPTSSKR